MSRDVVTRAAAIQAILATHGVGAVYVASTGYVARAVAAEVSPAHVVFYMQGSMGLAPALGLGMALGSERTIVVINGDGALLMSLGSTHTLRDHAPKGRLFHYVLDNGVHESVGGQACAPLEDCYPGVTQIVAISRDGKPPRVPIAPLDNSVEVRAALQA
jgi:phosphonopyruvate decarboxylase